MAYRYTGKELAKVLIYYGIIGDVETSEFSIVCPFHDDINPSMRINLDEGTFFCFGCRLMGNAYDFVRYANPELNDLQCCVLLEKILNSNEVKSINVKYKRKRKKKNRQALIEADDYFYGLKQMDWNNVETKEQQYVLEYMKQRGFDEKALNVADCRVSYNIAYPVIFPILDNGKFMGWVARTTNRYVEKKRKYMYNEGFKKRITLCGSYKENCIPIICEGYMDYLSIRTRGRMKNVVALLGWHISDEQIKKLKEKGIKTVISALDNDECGNKGTILLSKHFKTIRFQYPKGVKDCGEMDHKKIKECLNKTRRNIHENIINS